MFSLLESGNISQACPPLKNYNGVRCRRRCRKSILPVAFPVNVVGGFTLACLPSRLSESTSRKGTGRTDRAVPSVKNPRMRERVPLFPERGESRRRARKGLTSPFSFCFIPRFPRFHFDVLRSRLLESCRTSFLRREEKKARV